MPRLIHLSDLHFGAHDPVLVTAVEKRLDEEAPDLVVISGDFTQRARIEQFEEAGAFLLRIRDAGHEVLAVPGNHDVPLYDVLRRFLSPLTRYKRYIDDSLCPFIALPGAAVLGINTARSLTFKNGHVSHEQMAFIRETLLFLALCARPVNSGVMSALRLDPTLIPATPLLCNADVGEIIERLAEC